MRKRTKRKLRSCPTCKPNKTGHAVRWTSKELQALKLSEKEILDAKRKQQGEV